jgi:hypothetical protein
MEAFSAWHWVIMMNTLIFLMLMPSWLFTRIVAKAGISRWWALLGVLPLINLFALWWFAFIDWPSEYVHTSVIRTTRAYRDARRSS